MGAIPKLEGLRMQEAKGKGLGARLFKRYGLDALSAMALGLFRR